LLKTELQIDNEKDQHQQIFFFVVPRIWVI